MMKYLLMLSLVLVLVNCRYEGSQDEIGGEEWFELLCQAILFSDIYSDSVFIYERFENQDLRDVVEAMYEFGGEVYGYKTHNKVVKMIRSRSNKQIVERLDTLSRLRIIFASDTVNFNKTYLLISEPFFVDHNMFCFSLTRVERAQDRNDWVYFYLREEGRLKLLSVYDLHKDVFLKAY